jgi:hypothetical protein
MTDPPDRDERALHLRAEGTSFGSIAKQLEFRGAPSAYEAFLRAFHRRPVLERARIRQDELARLAQLRQHLNARTDLASSQLQAQQQVIQRMRDAILAE